MRVVLHAVTAVILLTATAFAKDARHLTFSSRQGEGVAYQTPPPPTTYDPATTPGPSTTTARPHLIPRPGEILSAFGNFVHQHHQDTAAAHHQAHAQHHVNAHGAAQPDVATTPAPGAAGPQPPHAQGILGGHLGGIMGGIGNHHQSHHEPEPHVVHTRTVFIEVTKRVTRHPVCMTVYGARPPCLPYNEYRPSPYKKPAPEGAYHVKAENYLRSDDGDSYHIDSEDDLQWSDKSEEYLILPTRVVSIGAASSAPETGLSRTGRYIERRSKPAATPVAAPSEPLKSDEAAAATPILDNAPVMAAAEEGRQGAEVRQGPLGGLTGAMGGFGAGISQLATNVGSMMVAPMGGANQHTPETRYELKTLWVTKVERFTDYRVTATLVAENCVPTDSKIPFCNSGYAGPSYASPDEYSGPPPNPYTEKPHIITTPRPPKKPGFPPQSGPQPPHHLIGGILHRPRPTTPPPTSPAPYAPAYAKPAPPSYQNPSPSYQNPPPSYQNPPPPSYQNPPPPTYQNPPPTYQHPAEYPPAPPPQYQAPAPALMPDYPPQSAEYPEPDPQYGPTPAPAQAYPAAEPAYPPPEPEYNPPQDYPPPEPALDYPVDSKHWRGSDNFQVNQNSVSNEAEQESA